MQKKKPNSPNNAIVDGRNGTILILEYPTIMLETFWTVEISKKKCSHVHFF